MSSKNIIQKQPAGKERLLVASHYWTSGRKSYNYLLLPLMFSTQEKELNAKFIPKFHLYLTRRKHFNRLGKWSTQILDMKETQGLNNRSHKYYLYQSL